MKIDEILIKKICSRFLTEGGFANLPGENFRIDASAWAILALKAAGLEKDKIVSCSREAIERNQFEDGRFVYDKEFPDSYWPTGLALLALMNDERFSSVVAMGFKYLTKSESVVFRKNKEKKVIKDHDSSIVGWPWTDNTYAWVVPTSYALIAFKKYNWITDKRIKNAIKLILDRQIPSGGWNYGDNFAFDTELYPFIDTTGLALTALKGSCEQNQIEKSINYLKKYIAVIHTPISLSWGILGLSAWGQRPLEADHLIMECIDREDYFGIYDTVSLSLLCLSWYSDYKRFGMAL